MAESFFDSLIADPENAAMHHACLEHPVVRGIGTGDLPDEVFRGYIEQDFLFLREYIRVLARGIAASPTLDAATLLADLVHSTLSLEIGSLRKLYAAFGGDPDTLDAGDKRATTRAYTDHLLAASAEGSLAVILASILPCQWGYRDIGQHLAAQGLPTDDRYAHWIRDYSSSEYGTLVDALITTLSALATTSGERELQRCRDVFAASAVYEHAFWEMAAGRNA
jgi:thiaminase/transcriptional activator TenA